MSYRLQWRYYRRPFRRPLKTGAATWSVREGVILRLENHAGDFALGEICPVPWFPVEQLDDAIALLTQWGQTYDPGQHTVPDTFPCTLFALGCALRKLEAEETSSSRHSIHSAALIPTTTDPVSALTPLIDQGYVTFKWKIGVLDRDSEWRQADQLFRQLHSKGILRLDANGSLNPDDFQAWTHFLREFPVEFFEQPLPPGQEELAHEIADPYGLTIAWDESACTLPALAHLSQQFPQAVFVIKPSQCGSPLDLGSWLSSHPSVRRVYSSAFETRLGFNEVCRLAAEDSQATEAAGLGIGNLFPEDPISPPLPAPVMHHQHFSQESEDALWKLL